MRIIFAILLCALAFPARAQTAPTTSTAAAAAYAASLQGIIDKADSVPATKALVTQRDALQKQLQALNKQIGDAEGTDVQAARQTLQTLNRPGMLGWLPRPAIPAPVAK